MRKTIFILIILLTFLRFPAFAAQDAWAVRCQDVDDQQECEMYQRLTLADTGERVAEFALGYPSHMPKGRGVIVLPLGVLLTDGAKLRIDDGKSYRFAMRYCTGEGCFAFIGLNDKLINQMKKGGEAVIAFKMMDGSETEISLSLIGFTKSYDEIKP